MSKPQRSRFWLIVEHAAVFAVFVLAAAACPYIAVPAVIILVWRELARDRAYERYCEQFPVHLDLTPDLAQMLQTTKQCLEHPNLETTLCRAITSYHALARWQAQDKVLVVRDAKGEESNVQFQ